MRELLLGLAVLAGLLVLGEAQARPTIGYVDVPAFKPAGQASLSVTTVTDRVALPTADETVVIYNTGTVDVRLKFGSSTVTATTSDYLLRAGWAVGFDAEGYTHVAAITASSSSTIQITTGDGRPTLSGSSGSITISSGATSIAKDEDAVHSNADTGVFVLCRRIDSAASSTATDGDYAAVNCDEFGGLRTIIQNPADGSDVTISTDKTEDTAVGSGDSGPAILINQDATPSDDATDGDYASPKMDDGAMWVRPLQTMATVDATITRIADHAAYAAGDSVSDSTSSPTAFTLTSACRVSGGTGIITDIIITDSDDAVVPLQGRIYIFDQSFTNDNDNAAFTMTDADMANIVTTQTFTLADQGDNDYGSIEDLAIGYTCSGSANLRFGIQATNAYDPAANSGSIKVRVKVLHTS